MSDRFTKIKAPDFRSKSIPQHTEIPQGSAVSPPLYCLYNSDLIEEVTKSEVESLGIEYVDDVGLLVSGDTVEDCIDKLKILYPICR